jgi:hypothetical protein
MPYCTTFTYVIVSSVIIIMSNKSVPRIARGHNFIGNEPYGEAGYFETFIITMAYHTSNLH